MNPEGFSESKLTMKISIMRFIAICINNFHVRFIIFKQALSKIYIYKTKFKYNEKNN